MIRNGYRYVGVKGKKLMKDIGNDLIYVSQRPVKATVDDDGVEVFPESVAVTAQITKDLSEPIIDKKTGEIKEDNTLETFEAVVVGAKYPLPLRKGCKIKFENFLEDYSYYINFNFVLRFGSIKELPENE